MNYIEYNPAMPSEYESYVPIVQKEKERKTYFFLIGAIIIITVAVIGFHLYNLDTIKSKRNDKE